MEQISLFEKRYNSGRSNLLFMAILTVANIIITAAEIELYFPFSASVPFIAYMIGEEAKGVYFVMGVALAIIMILVYVLCFILSKKIHGFMIAALVIFSLDTLALIGLMIFAFEAGLLVDLAFHGWVLYYLIIAVASISKMKMEKEVVETENVLADNVG